MTGFILRRLASLLATMLVMALVVFWVLMVLPGDPAVVMLGTEARPDTLAALQQQMGLDQPAPLRFLFWLAGCLRGDLGVSHTYARPVTTLLIERLAITGPLTLLALLLAIGIALPLGVLAAARHLRPLDIGVQLFGQLGIAVPSFWLGILLILLFALGLGWFPAGGFPGWSAEPRPPLPAVRALLLPALALAIPEAAILVRVTRAAMLDTLNEDYMRTAHAKGLPPRAALWKHAFANAVLPVLTILGLQAGFLVAGTVVVENVFALPGIGRLVFQAVAQRDLPVVQAVITLLAATVVLLNTAVDLLVAVIDPRPSAVHPTAR